MKAIYAVPATLALCYRAWSHKSLTPAGIVAAALTAIAHAVHPWSLPFALLVVFFLAGTRVTKVRGSLFLRFENFTVFVRLTWGFFCRSKRMSRASSPCTLLVILAEKV